MILVLLAALVLIVLLRVSLKLLGLTKSEQVSELTLERLCRNLDAVARMKRGADRHRRRRHCRHLQSSLCRIIWHVNWLHRQIRMLMASNPQTELRQIAALLAQIAQFYTNFTRVEIQLIRYMYLPPKSTEELLRPVRAIQYSVRSLTLERLYRL